MGVYSSKLVIALALIV